MPKVKTLFSYFTKTTPSKRLLKDQNDIKPPLHGSGSSEKKANNSALSPVCNLSQFSSPIPTNCNPEKEISDTSSIGSTEKCATFSTPKMKNCTSDIMEEKQEIEMEDTAAFSATKSRRSSVKKRRIIESDDDLSNDEDSEFKPGKVESSSENYSSDATASDEENCSPQATSGMKRKRGGLQVANVSSIPSPCPTIDTVSPSSSTGPGNSTHALPKTPVVSKSTVARLSAFKAADDRSSKSAGSDTQQMIYMHETLLWLKPGKVRDKSKRFRDDKDYDASTLFVPNDFLQKQTPAMHQWWTLKSNNFNVVLFFKVGKFYELYHMDATIGVQELGLTYMKGAYAHSGFPEISFGRFAETLVQKGYTIARVEQTETPEQNALRLRGKCASKHEKTLRREICQLTTKGTQLQSSWDGSVTRESQYMLAVIEQSLGEGNGDLCREFGVCFVDTMIGTFKLDQFTDDRHCSRLVTLLARYVPCHVLYERGKLSVELSKILRTGLSAAVQTALQPNTQFWNAEKTLKTIQVEKYFETDGEFDLPAVLKQMTSNHDVLGSSAASGHQLELQCLGACMFYLKKCLIDREVLTMGRFERCENAILEGASSRMEDQISNYKTTKRFELANRHMVLDSVTLSNLEVLTTSAGTSEGSLLGVLDNCRTQFGKRLLKQWVCSPLCQPNEINARLDAITALVGNAEFMSSINIILCKLPDLEKQLMRVHSLSKGARRNDHPDNRAVLFEEKIYRKQQIISFIDLLEHFKSIFTKVSQLQDRVASSNSILLQSALGITPIGEFPDIKQLLLHWEKVFDRDEAKESGKITPNAGTNAEYDQALNDISLIQHDLDKYLHAQRRRLQCSRVEYRGSGNKRYQLDLPDNSISSKLIPDEYVVSGQRKGFRSFRTNETQDMLKRMEEAEVRRDQAQSETMAIVFREFHKDYVKWISAVRCLAICDVILSMTDFTIASQGDGPICRPEFMLNNGKPFLQLVEARHPVLARKFFGGDFIPNDTTLGKDDQPECLLLTGPNMGGKSTLMRQVGLSVVLAQLGCYVPASKCCLSPCDRIFTRLGASDRIMSGESTFYVELSETSTILKHATTHSIVLLDELGRGTSTYDGTAIASAVLSSIVSHPACRTIFSTHYHSLVNDVQHMAGVGLGHMSCMVEETTKEDDDDPDRITFLYKLVPGACPKSYGFHAALLAGVPRNIVQLARRTAIEMETKIKNLQLFRHLMASSKPDLEILSA